MIYNFTGVQHLKTGDVTIPIIGFEDEEACQARYHHEMEYALLNKNFNGLTIIIFNNRGEIIIHDNWIRKVPDPVPEIIQEEEQQTEDPEEVESEEPETEEIESEDPKSDEDGNE